MKARVAARRCKTWLCRNIVWQLLGMALVSASVAPAEHLDYDLLREALTLLPPDLSFPLNGSHVVVIENYAQFVKAHPELGAPSDLQARGKRLYAFTIGQCWPIHLNFEGHHILTTAYARPRGHWVAYLIAAVLVHEAVHARGDARESAALLEELMLDRSFQRKGKLPAQVVTDKLADQYLSAIEQERSRTSGPSGPVRSAKRYCIPERLHRTPRPADS